MNGLKSDTKTLYCKSFILKPICVDSLYIINNTICLEICLEIENFPCGCSILNRCGYYVAIIVFINVYNYQRNLLYVTFSKGQEEKIAMPESYYIKDTIQREKTIRK